MRQEASYLVALSPVWLLVYQWLSPLWRQISLVFLFSLEVTSSAADRGQCHKLDYNLYSITNSYVHPYGVNVLSYGARNQSF